MEDCVILKRNFFNFICIIVLLKLLNSFHIMILIDLNQLCNKYVTLKEGTDHHTDTPNVLMLLHLHRLADKKETTFWMESIR